MEFGWEDFREEHSAEIEFEIDFRKIEEVNSFSSIT